MPDSYIEAWENAATEPTISRHQVSQTVRGVIHNLETHVLLDVMRYSTALERHNLRKDLDTLANRLKNLAEDLKSERERVEDDMRMDMFV